MFQGQKWNSAAFVPIVLLILFMRERHEAWRDEIAHWAFTRYSGPMQIFSEYLEAGSFGYLVLYKCLTLLTLDFNFISNVISIALAVALLRFFYAPNLTLVTKLLFVNPLFATQYLIVTRDYTLIFMLLILFLSLERNKPRWQLSSFCVLALMASLGFWGFYFASLLLFTYRKQWNWHEKSYQLITFIVIIIVNFLPIIFRAMSINTGHHGTNLQVYGLAQSIDIFRWNLTSSIVTPRNPASSELGVRIISNYSNLLILEFMSYIIILGILYFIHQRNVVDFWSVFVFLVLIIFFLTFIYPGGTRHFAAIWLTLLIGFTKSQASLNSIPYNNPRVGKKILKSLALFLATLQLVGYSSLIKADLTKSFSTTQQIKSARGSIAFFPAYLTYGYLTRIRPSSNEVNSIYQIQGDYFGVPSEVKMKTNRVGNLHSRLCSSNEINFFLVTTYEFANVLNLLEVGEIVQITEEALVSEEGSIVKIKIKCSTFERMSLNFTQLLRKTL